MTPEKKAEFQRRAAEIGARVQAFYASMPDDSPNKGIAFELSALCGETIAHVESIDSRVEDKGR